MRGVEPPRPKPQLSDDCAVAKLRHTCMVAEARFELASFSLHMRRTASNAMRCSAGVRLSWGQTPVHSAVAVGAGVEPAPSRLTAERTTSCAIPHQSLRQDLNPQLLRSKRSVHPLHYEGKLERTAGLEPALIPWPGTAPSAYHYPMPASTIERNCAERPTFRISGGCSDRD